MAIAEDRRAGKGYPRVGKELRARNQDGSWRKKRSDASKPKSKQGKWGTPPAGTCWSTRDHATC